MNQSNVSYWNYKKQTELNSGPFYSVLGDKVIEITIN